MGRAHLLLVTVLLASCKPPGKPEPPPKPEAIAPVSQAPLEARREETRPLRDRNGRTIGVVSIPGGPREKRPLVVAVHGAAGRADGMCNAARWSLGPSPVVVCPHPIEGIATEASWSSAWQIRERIDDAVEAARDDLTETADAIYLGHSQGAMLAPSTLALSGRTTFRYAIFFEGLPRDAFRAKSDLVRARIERLFLVSGQSGWSRAHSAFAESFRGTPVVARHVHVEVGHFMNGEVHALLRREMDWLAGDARAWKGHLPSP